MIACHQVGRGLVCAPCTLLGLYPHTQGQDPFPFTCRAVCVPHSFAGIRTSLYPWWPARARARVLHCTRSSLVLLTLTLFRESVH
ncbi:hypothetical protein BCR44DRAFT_1439482, partial [Catenaria anguillulae PL171]